MQLLWCGFHVPVKGHVPSFIKALNITAFKILIRKTNFFNALSESVLLIFCTTVDGYRNVELYMLNQPGAVSHIAGL